MCTCGPPVKRLAVSATPAPKSSGQPLASSESIIAAPLPDGYWVEPFPFSNDSQFPDLIAFGLGFEGAPSVARIYINPKNTRNPDGGEWGVGEIGSFDFPVAIAYTDFTGDGFNDVIIIDRYGPSIQTLWDADTMDGGRLLWLKNPGQRGGQAYWESHRIGKATGMHRVKVGHFSTQDVIQVLGLPILKKGGDFENPAPVIVYTPTYGEDRSQGPQEWTEEIPYPSHFRVIHEVRILQGANNGLDMALVAGKEGVSLLWYDQEASLWRYRTIGTGLRDPNPPIFYGCGSVDICRVGDDPIGYIVTCEALHGNNVAVLTKDEDAPKGIESLLYSNWTRTVIDNYGPLDPEGGTGTIHQVTAIQMEANGMQSFGAACMGAPIGKPENQGIYLYKPTNLHPPAFDKVKLSDGSAAHLVLAAYTDPHRRDIASISYYVPHYHTGPDPSQLRINVLSPPNFNFSASKLNKEVLLRIPRPNTIPQGVVPMLPFWGLGGRQQALVILPPRASTKLPSGVTAIKIIYGQVRPDSQNDYWRIAPAARTAKRTTVGDQEQVTAGDAGAVFVILSPDGSSQGPFSNMSQVKSDNILPPLPSFPKEVLDMKFPFVKVEDLAWAHSGLWDKFEFYNAVGFHVYFNDDAMEKIVHIQAWTLGIGETARFHNHMDQSFCEIHYCLSNGGGSAGMRYFTREPSADEIGEVNGTTYLINELDKAYVESNSELVVVPDMSEHGPLWRIQPGFDAKPIIRPNDTVDYPFHAWLASQFGDHTLPIAPPLEEDEQRYDVWLAFEFPPSAFQY